MAMLLNRNPSGRLECLYYILKSLYAKYKTIKTFSLQDIKFNPNDQDNVHNYCQLLIDCVGFRCCRYLKNPLDNSKCYAVQSIESDSTKSKAASDVGGALEALGFIIRKNGNVFAISDSGERWVKSDYYSSEWQMIAREAVLSYGPIIGLLNKLREMDDTFRCSGLYLGYPETNEVVEYHDEFGKTVVINISTDSQKDSNTRTMSRLIAWCVTVGLLEPIGQVNTSDSEQAHLKYRDFLLENRLTIRSFKKTALCKSVFNTKRYVNNPLSYARLHKNVGSLRENGGQDLRRATLMYNSNILNRRYVFVYALNEFSANNKPLDINKLISKMTEYRELFFSSGNDEYEIMYSESSISDLAGIPFDSNGNYLSALTTINKSVLEEDAPPEMKKVARKIYEDISE